MVDEQKPYGKRAETIWYLLTNHIVRKNDALFREKEEFVMSTISMSQLWQVFLQ